METVVNKYHVRVRKWCASCEQKVVDDDGNRICSGMQLRVPQDFICPKWELSVALQKVGLMGGVVRLKGTTTEIIK